MEDAENTRFLSEKAWHFIDNFQFSKKSLIQQASKDFRK